MEIYNLKLGEIAANCYVIADEESSECAVIDPGDCTDELLSLVDGLGKTKYILLTHGHYDHILGVYDLHAHTGAPVAIHSADAEKLLDEQLSLATHTENKKQKPIKADILLNEGDKLKVGDITLRVMHTPGHSAGGVCFVCDSEKVIFSGDTLFCRTIGRTDFYDGDFDEIMNSVNLLTELNGYTVYPGHNRATTIDDEILKNRFLRKR